MQPRLPPSSAYGPLITIMPGPRMEGIASCDADGRGKARDPRVHDGEYCTRDRGEVVGSDGADPPFPHPSGVRGVKGDMKIVEESYL